MSSPIVYTKNGEDVKVAAKFIYCSSVYCIWKNGASLMEEKRYASPAPLIESKMKLIVKRKNCTIRRFLDLEGAPEYYLINNGYKRKSL